MTIESKFKVGDQVYHATFEPHERWDKCPDCLGSKFAKVTFADGLEVTVDCGSCQSGFAPPSGLIKFYVHEPLVRYVLVEGIDIRRHQESGYEIRYSLSDHRGGSETDIFTNEKDAQDRAELLAHAWEADEQVRIARKDKPSGSWAQNASYHRKALKAAQRDAEYHTRKLNVAEMHKREEKAQSVEEL